MKRQSYNQQLLDAIIQGKEKPVNSKREHSVEAYESDIQQQCLQWFALQYREIWGTGLLFHIPNEGIRLGRMGSRMKREGVRRGVADLCLAIPRHGYGALYIEMKRPGGRQSPEQRAWQKNAEKYGNKYVICHSLEEFMFTIKRYLN